MNSLKYVTFGLPYNIILPIDPFLKKRKSAYLAPPLPNSQEIGMVTIIGMMKQYVDDIIYISSIYGHCHPMILSISFNCFDFGGCFVENLFSCFRL